MMNFVGPAKRIEDPDLPRIARTIGVGEDELHAIMDVEAPKSGFDSQSRPRILFEPHVFYRNLSGEKRQAAVAQGLAYAGWKAGAYGPESAQYERLQRAMAIDETAALKACSWGRAQILGENYRAAGYGSVQDMVRDFTLDEDNHLEAMIRFIKHNKLDDELRAHDWAGFARGYNGSSYASHGYHTRLAAAYDKWARVKDTPFTNPSDAEPPMSPKPPASTATKVIVGGTAATTAGTVAAQTQDPFAFWLAAGVALAIAAITLVMILRGR